jgi:hypothetical protein
VVRTVVLDCQNAADQKVNLIAVNDHVRLNIIVISLENVPNVSLGLDPCLFSRGLESSGHIPVGHKQRPCILVKAILFGIVNHCIFELLGPIV